jgi:hypothetical protein
VGEVPPCDKDADAAAPLRAFGWERWPPRWSSRVGPSASTARGR